MLYLLGLPMALDLIISALLVFAVARAAIKHNQGVARG